MLVRNIEFCSPCEYHGDVPGPSIPARTVDMIARRLQVQEQLPREIGEAAPAVRA